METNRPGFCIFINTLGEGTIPSVRDNGDKPCVFTTRVEAELEIADLMITRLQEFIDGEREFEDAIATEEFVVEVDVLSDGSVIDSEGNHFGAR